MKFNITDYRRRAWFQEKDYKGVQYKWHPYFSWLPTWIEDEWHWLSYIDRRRAPYNDEHIEYRAPTKKITPRVIENTVRCIRTNLFWLLIAPFLLSLYFETLTPNVSNKEDMQWLTTLVFDTLILMARGLRRY